MKYSIKISINIQIENDDEIMNAADELLNIVQQVFLLEMHDYFEMGVDIEEKNSIILFEIEELEKENLDGVIAATKEIIAIIREEFLPKFSSSEIISIFPPIN